MILKQKIRRFFEDNPQIKRRTIEKEAGLFYNALSNYLSGSYLKEEQMKALVDALKNHGFKE